MIPILCAAGYLSLLVWLGARRRFLLCLMAACLVGFSMRFVSVVYLDAAGPVYSLQLFRDIGGAGAAAPLLLAYLIYVAAFLVVFRATTMRTLAVTADRLVASGPTSTDRLIASAVFGAYVVFVALLFLDLFRIGVIPLFAGLERFEYTQQYGGFWHQLLMNYGMLLALPLGAFYSLGMFFRKRGDIRFLGLLLAIFVYLFLAGHRFSAFYSHSAAFVMPYAAVLGWQQFSERLSEGERRRQELLARRVLAGALAVMVVLVGVALYRSYFFTRASDQKSPFESLRQRVFVQQGEMWYATWDRVVARRFDPVGAIDRLFVHPVVPDRNSTMPYLMLREIDEKAYTTLDVGSVYSGGFPEVFFELFPPAGAYAVIFMVALTTAQLMKVLLLAVLERRYLRLALSWYVLFGLVLVSLSGMLNSVVNWKYWLKVAALVTWIAIELDRDVFRRIAAGRSAVPLKSVGRPEALR